MKDSSVIEKVLREEAADEENPDANQGAADSIRARIEFIGQKITEVSIPASISTWWTYGVAKNTIASPAFS